MKYTSGIAGGTVAGGATLASTGASNTGQLLLAASIALVAGAVMTWAASTRRRRADVRVAGE
ncbi:hypothetical protein [Actinacidiphila oryziradicis]|jgi:hypothetical protein|uniref:LPXTG cell wall anchor domain-containing protein n=1 Tax=Actinacidiphila oryziradicis TaxID=2571141 RepID=A0A4V5MXR4_9ACTN|nr:hypothetical protein [Actinacidiphila oryziradicis]TKA00749.1 hypothetical protein FCI23_41950 [Actinacidiphila oryziradicis]